jgi:Na+-transporting NADH:ubiquinone oxidoreductase subunit C
MPKPDANTGNWALRILNMPNDSVEKTLVVAVAMCLVCAVVVASAAVFLKPIQLVNQTLDVKKNILQAGDLYQEGMNINETFKEKVEIRIVDLESGEYTDAVDPTTYDQRKAAGDPELSEAVPADQDIAKVKRRAKYAPVYLIKDGEQLKTLILPVRGYGLWSMMYAFIALEPDLETVEAVKFYEQGETAGLGGEVANPDWQAKWAGKKLFGDKGTPRIELIKGSVDSSTPNAEYKIDGLAGSTLTSRGVTNLMHYWLGENGFGPYLDRLKNEKG